jgi:hypothetical protein
VDENISTPTFRLDETEALLRTKPLDGANSHDVLQPQFEAPYSDNRSLSRVQIQRLAKLLFRDILLSVDCVVILPSLEDKDHFCDRDDDE